VLPGLASLPPDGLVSWRFAGMAAVVFAAALMQGIGGVGFAMVSAPIAVLFFRDLVPGPLLVLGAGMALLGAWREFAHIDWRGAGTMTFGRVVGTAAAGAILSVLPPGVFAIVFAVLILTAVGFSFAGWRVFPTAANMIVAGVASGLMSTITASGASPFAIVMQSVEPARMRATLGCVFFAGALLSLGALAAVGMFTIDQFWLGLLLFPPMGAGFAASSALNALFSRDAMRVLILSIAALGAVGVLAQALLAGLR
jgi:uncharacterized membrane protein YfcA